MQQEIVFERPLKFDIKHKFFIIWLPSRQIKIGILHTKIYLEKSSTNLIEHCTDKKVQIGLPF